MEATDSIWTVFLFHFCVNGFSVVSLYLLNALPDGMMDVVLESSTEVTNNQLLITISFYVLLAIICTPLAGCVLTWMGKNEGRVEAIKLIWSSRKIKENRYFTIILFLAVFLCVIMMLV